MTPRGELDEDNTTEIAIDVIAHTDLTTSDIGRLRRLFDAEYNQEFGEWDPELPYGYAPHDFHIVARQHGEVVGHVGWARRSIHVGDHEIVVGGVGGVLVSDCARGQRLGGRLMIRAAESMSAAGSIAFGYLGCREDVVSFYTACGWSRISAAENSISRAGKPVFDAPGQPLLILPIEAPLSSWPVGEVDLRGRAW